MWGSTDKYIVLFICQLNWSNGLWSYQLLSKNNCCSNLSTVGTATGAPVCLSVEAAHLRTTFALF